MPKIKITSSLLWPLVILLIAFGAFYFKPWQTKPAEIISVTAEGKAEAVPNIAKITATMESKNPNLDLARQENEKKTSEVIQSLKALGVEEKDIKTQNISGGQTYEIQSDQSRPNIQIYPPINQRPTNQVSTTFEVTIRDFTKTDEIIAALTQNGAANIYGPNLTLDDQTLENAKSKARENAVLSAKTKAEQLAKLSNRKLGKATKINEQGDYAYPTPILARGEADLKAQASQIQPGQNEVSVNIQVEFEIK